MKSCVLSVLLLNVFSRFVSPLYFHVGDTEKKCFLEDIPDDTRVSGHYQARLYDRQRDGRPPANQDLRIFVEVKDPEDKLILSQVFGSEKTFKFTSRREGKHQICLQPDSSQRPLAAGGLLTVQLDIRSGEQTNNYTEIAAREKLTELRVRIRQLAEQVQQIQKEQEYQRLREKRFREVDHNTNMWIFWWPVVRSLYVVFVITWMTNSW